MPPQDKPAVHCVDQALKTAPEGVEVIMLGELNMRLRYPRGEQEEDLATALVDIVLVNMTDHFLP